MSAPYQPPKTVAEVLAQVYRPKRMVVTAGMPYANGPLHLGHLAGAQLPADIYARYMGMLIGRQNVLYVCGNDDHGSTSEVAALQKGVPIREFIDGIHVQQKETMRRYSIGLDVFSGTSQPDCFPIHKALSNEFLQRINANGMLSKRTSNQWYDLEAKRFLPDRLVRGTCPNPKCGSQNAYSNECGQCGHQHEPQELKNPKSVVTGSTPEMRETMHWWLDMGAVSETLRAWLLTKQKTWRPAVLSHVMDDLMPSVRFAKEHEEAYKALKATLPKHKQKYTSGKQVLLQFENKADRTTGEATLSAASIAHEQADEWAVRSITRDIAWGIPIEGEPDLAGKTLYVWPDSLIAPIAFSQVALKARGEDPARYVEFWKDPEARITQFLGQDNVFFYVLMQGAMWLGSQENPHRQPAAGEWQMTDVIGCYHLLVNGEKMSKSTGNFYTGDQLLAEKGYSPDQIRYYLALLGLAEKASDFDFVKLDARNKFLAGPMNAAFEKPISAVHSKYDGKVPEGTLDPKVVAETVKIAQRYVKAMEKANFPSLLFEVENYARSINSLFTQYKPHDDRFPEEARKNALYTCFYVLKNLMILLYPFVPETMNRLRESLRLPESVFSLDELGTAIPAGHVIGPKGSYFPAVEGIEGAEDEARPI